MVCLDTSVIIDFLAGEKKTVELIGSYARKERISTTTITEYELLKHQKVILRELAERFLDRIIVHPFDKSSAKESADFYVRLENQGKLVNENDILIAGITAATGETLLTKDKKFSNFASASIIVL